MTVSTELAKSAHRIEWILCLEGVGWPVNEADLSEGFAGDVFITNDFAGTLATDLGCSVHFGLFLPMGISEKVDPRMVKWEHGGMRFSVQDQDDVLLETIRPLDSTGRAVELAVGGPLIYKTSTVVLDEANDTFAEGDVAWIGSSEAVLLGTRSAGGGSLFAYADCVRGYLGTPRGRFDPRPTGLDGLGWAEATDVRDYNRHWYDRRVHLYMHVPGEDPENCVRVYTGRTRTITQTKQALVWDFATVHDMALGIGRIREAAVQNLIGVNEFYDSTGQYNGRPGVITYGVSDDGMIGAYQLQYADRRVEIFQHQGDALEYYGLGFFYHYRRARGGTGGVKTAIDADPTAPQAYQDGAGRSKISAVISLNEQFYWARHKAPADDGVEHDWRTIIVQGTRPDLGAWQPSLLGGSGPVRYLLDNYEDSASISRWAVNNHVSRNVIDVALMIMTSCNNEFYRDDSDGSSDTVITFATATPFDELPADYWAGYAVHCVDGANIGEARVITASDDSSLTVDTPFSNTPSDGDEYQIRNTIYDVLSLGWGRSVMNWEIDLEAWEDLRDNYLGDAKIGRFAMGDEDKVDVQAILQENIFQPYGILPFMDRATGRLSATYIGEALPDGLVETYATIGVADILDIGNIELVPYAPAGSLELSVRAAGTVVVPGWGQVQDSMNGATQAAAQAPYEERFIEPGLGGKTQTIVLKPTELDSVFRNQKLETLQMKALLNSVDDTAVLAPRLIRHLARQANPPPEVNLKLNISWFPRVHAGQILLATDTTKWRPVNPYTGARGWSSVPVRVIGINLSTDNKPGVQLRVQILEAGAQAKVAPAALVLSKGTDGGGDFVTCEDFEYAIDEGGDEDWSLFGAGDRIELRSVTGALKEGPEIVVGTPASSKVYIAGTWASVIAAGDYITFSAWSNSNTASMDTYSALADTAGTLGAGNNPAKEYA